MAVAEQVSRRLDTKDKVLKSFTDTLFGKADPELIKELGADGLLAIAKRALGFMAQRDPDEVLLRVYTPSYQVDGWEAPYTVLEFCLGDRPFIVDSVKAELKRQNLELLYLLHPIVSVKRDDAGKFVAFADDGSRESFELYFVEKINAEALKPLKKAVYGVLEDVVLATRDYHALRDKAGDIARYLQVLSEEGQSPERKEELLENASFMTWLQDDNYVFLGYREYDIVSKNNVAHLQMNAASGLGLLSKTDESAYQQSVPLSEIPEGLRERVTGGRTLVVTKTNAESTVHRPARMDYIGVKKLLETTVTGEQRFIGLFTSKGLSTPVADIPILRLKLRRVLELDNAVPGSHDYKQITAIFNSMPREELFWRGAEELHDDIRTIMNLEQEQGVRLTLRPDPLGRGLAAMVMMPRERFNAEVRRAVQEYLQEQLAATHVDYQLAMGEDESQLRFHFFFITQKNILSTDVKGLEREVIALTRTWEDELFETLAQTKGDSEARRLFETYQQAFSEAYKADTSSKVAVRDIEQFEKLKETSYCVDVLNTLDGDSTQVKIYHHKRGLVLSEVMPVLENLGLRVLEQISYPLEDTSGLDIFRVQDQHAQPLDVLEHGERLRAALATLLSGHAENDRLNKLVLYGALTLRQVALLRAYLVYYAQLNSATSPRFVADTLLKYPAISALLFEAFYVKFDPKGANRIEAFASAQSNISDALNNVSSLPEDTVLRGLLNLIDASVRSNFFLHKDVISFKLESKRVLSMPEPRPLYEIAVSGLGVDGTHLRGGKVARGGLRWSDRPDDFRTEVLGLMKTQMTKNAVIVPVGSKGGFVLKRAPQEREAVRGYVQEQYKNFICGLLDLTDNLVDGNVVHPKDLVIYDEADPYLVVAADKGTATFSDLANETAAEYTFWLGDAFASGGSYGYDHKKEGITARGAWECVSRHFREMGLNIREQAFTCVGIGDMSGDVFGNGMLYTDKLKLQGAFNHQHIFLDPTPDAAKSFAERQRLFVLPRSSWSDYDKSIISEGGGIFERAAKTISLSPQVKTMLGVSQDSLSGQELVKSLLKMPVDLLWNGGIGTYVKSSSESNADVGDSSNDAVRISAHELRAKVIGEGGNLGFTQLARVEYARAGGRLNTDAIDNSAGVDMSDHEVNIKILLQPWVSSGELSFVQRNRLLKDMTEEVNALVLKDNYAQSLCLSLAEKRSRDDIMLFDAQIDYLSEHGGLNVGVEFLPTKKVMLERQKANEGLTRPELAILLAYTKMGIYRWLLESKLPDEPYFQHYLKDYFPQVLEEKYPEAIGSHALRREIIATQFTNSVVNLMGITFVQRVARDTGAAPGDIICATLVSFELLEVDRVQQEIFALDTVVPVTTQYSVLHELVKTVEGCVAWVLQQQVSNVEAVVTRYSRPLARLRETLGKVLSPTESKHFDSSYKTYLKQKLPKTLAASLAGLEYLPSSLAVIEVSEVSKVALEPTAKAFFEVGEVLSLGYVRDGLASLVTTNKWEKIALNSLILDLRALQAELTKHFLAAKKVDKSLSVKMFLETKTLSPYEQTLTELRGSDTLSLASGQVLARLLEQLCRELASHELAT